MSKATKEEQTRTYKIEDEAIAPYYISCDENNFSIYKDLPSGYRPLAIGHYSTLVSSLRKIQDLKVLEKCLVVDGSVTIAMYIDVLLSVSKELAKSFPQIELNVTP